MGNCCQGRDDEDSRLTSSEMGIPSGSRIRSKYSEERRFLTEVRPTELEQKIFDTLLEVVEENGLQTTMRVAGGWVRDKLLGKESDDIDITLDDMKGEAFAKLVDAKVNKGKNLFGTTKANKEKSKYFETTGMHIHGISIDFVNFWNFDNAH